MSHPPSPPRPRRLWPARRAVLWAWPLWATACAPVHDWRDVRSADGVVMAQMPCKPQLHERRVAIDGQAVRLSLLACEAGGQTWGLASATLADPARHGAALDELAAAAAGNVASTARTMPLRVTGSMAHPGNRRLVMEGRRPDGRAAQMQMALFVHGLHLYQATVLGERVPADLADTYLGSLRVEP